MICPNCSNLNDDNSTNCTTCGAVLTSNQNLNQPIESLQSNIVNNTIQKKKNNTPIIIIVVVACLIVAGIFLFGKSDNKQNESNSNIPDSTENNNSSTNDSNLTSDEPININKIPMLNVHEVNIKLGETTIGEFYNSVTTSEKSLVKDVIFYKGYDKDNSYDLNAKLESTHNLANETISVQAIGVNNQYRGLAFSLWVLKDESKNLEDLIIIGIEITDSPFQDIETIKDFKKKCGNPNEIKNISYADSNVYRYRYYIDKEDDTLTLELEAKENDDNIIGVQTKY